jgi:thioredoxin reductase (NADPH)
VPGEEDLIGADVHFCATCDGPFYKGADEVVVTGAGNSALEEGLHLSEFAKKFRVLARSGLTASPLLQECSVRPAVRHPRGVGIVALEGERGRFAAVVARDRDRGAVFRFRAAAAFVFIGLKPNDAFLCHAVERDAGGFLVTTPTMETSMAGVFAAGDVRSGSIKQRGSAADGRIATLLMTRRYLEAHHHKAVPATPAWKLHHPKRRMSYSA